MILSNVLPLATRSIRVRLLACLLLFSFAAGCRSRQDNPLSPQEGTVTTTIAGRVTDESGAGLSGVSVTGSGKTAITDANGLFSLPNVSASASHAFVIAKKA